MGCIKELSGLPITEVASLRVGESDVVAVPSARNIGVQLDNKLNMVEHAKGVRKSAYMHL